MNIQAVQSATAWSQHPRILQPQHSRNAMVRQAPLPAADRWQVPQVPFHFSIDEDLQGSKLILALHLSFASKLSLSPGSAVQTNLLISKVYAVVSD